jgi:hypothetical protein
MQTVAKLVKHDSVTRRVAHNDDILDLPFLRIQLEIPVERLTPEEYYLIAKNVKQVFEVSLDLTLRPLLLRHEREQQRMDFGKGTPTLSLRSPAQAAEVPAAAREVLVTSVVKHMLAGDGRSIQPWEDLRKQGATDYDIKATLCNLIGDGSIVGTIRGADYVADTVFPDPTNPADGYPRLSITTGEGLNASFTIIKDRDLARAVREACDIPAPPEPVEPAPVDEAPAAAPTEPKPEPTPEPTLADAEAGESQADQLYYQLQVGDTFKRIGRLPTPILTVVRKYEELDARTGEMVPKLEATDGRQNYPFTRGAINELYTRAEPKPADVPVNVHLSEILTAGDEIEAKPAFRNLPDMKRRTKVLEVADTQIRTPEGWTPRAVIDERYQMVGA